LAPIPVGILILLSGLLSSDELKQVPNCILITAQHLRQEGQEIVLASCLKSAPDRVQRGGSIEAQSAGNALQRLRTVRH
jgi:hypothetical protein